MHRGTFLCMCNTRDACSSRVEATGSQPVRDGERCVTLAAQAQSPRSEVADGAGFTRAPDDGRRATSRGPGRLPRQPPRASCFDIPHILFRTPSIHALSPSHPFSPLLSPHLLCQDWKNAEEKNILSARQEGNPEGTAILNPFYHDIPSPDALKNL